MVDSKTEQVRKNKIRYSLTNNKKLSGGWSLCIQISTEQSYSLPIYWYHSKGNWLRYNFAVDSFFT